MALYQEQVSDRLIATPLVSFSGSLGVVVNDRLRFIQTQSFEYTHVLILAEVIRLKPAVATNGSFHVAVQAIMKLHPFTGGIASLSLTSRLRLHVTASARTIIRVLEALDITAKLAVSAHFKTFAGDSVKLAPMSKAAWLKSVADEMKVHPTLTQHLIANVRAEDRLLFEEAVSVTMIVLIQHTDTVEFNETLGIKGIYKNSLFEVVDLSIRLKQPNGTTTVWATNSRTGAVTEYQDYAYDSFLRLPNGVYLGAGNDGNLYELQGDTDNAAPIIIDVIGGLLDMGGSHFTSLKAAYLGMRASGIFYLKLTTDNDITRTYEVRTRPLHTARVDIGKGLRGRYVQWELISTGQDLDLQSIEFIPLVSKRRV